MKKKLFKMLLVVISVAYIFVAVSTPAYAVISNRTPTMYVYQEESYGTVTLYPNFAQASTYCEWGTNNRQVYVGHSYRDQYNSNHYKENNYYWGTYRNYSGTSLAASTTAQNDVYINEYAVSMHRVKVGIAEWTYEDDETEEPYLYAR